jgi:hypothetical protein
MLQRFQGRVGTAGLIVAIVALVLALGGGAYAASGALTSKQKKEVTKIAQTEAKKFAKAGTTGPEGKQGPAGAAGAKGENGAAGTAGTNGTPGMNGKGVEVIPVPSGQTECGGNGGAVLEPEEVQICNGSPWTVGALPSGKTEMGTWAAGHATAAGESIQSVPLSFSVPLTEGSAVSEVHYVNREGNEEEGGEVVAEPAVNCHGTKTNPTAPAGILCIYEATNSGTILVSAAPQGRAGVVLEFQMNGEGTVARGTWAVTAP